MQLRGVYTETSQLKRDCISFGLVYARRVKLMTTLLVLGLVALRPGIGLGADMTHAVKVNLVGMKVPGKPPLERLLVDVHIRNDEKTPRWVLLPSRLPLTPGGIDKLEQHTTKAGAIEVAVGRFLGTGGRYAVRLAPGARVILRKLEVAWWRPEKASEVSFDVQLAAEVTLGGEPMASWFDKNPMIQGIVEVDMETAKHTASHRAPGDKEVAVSVTGATTTSIKLSPP